MRESIRVEERERERERKRKKEREKREGEKDKEGRLKHWKKEKDNKEYWKEMFMKFTYSYILKSVSSKQDRF